jgi:dTDP-4-dehydrorhamnose 3,5-epimerase-like enzyme
MYSRFEKNRYSGFKYNEPFFAIDWPCEPVVISDQDLNWPIFQSTQNF